jgi:hypothetical protein
MQPPSSSSPGPHKAAMSADFDTEENMRLLTNDDLNRYTEIELWDLYRNLLLLLPTLRDGSLDHLTALMNLQIIRERLSSRLSPRPW